METYPGVVEGERTQKTYLRGEACREHLPSTLTTWSSLAYADSVWYLPDRKAFQRGHPLELPASPARVRLFTGSSQFFGPSQRNAVSGLTWKEKRFEWYKDLSPQGAPALPRAWSRMNWLTMPKQA